MATKKAPHHRTAGASAGVPIEYSDFVLRGTRVDRRSIAITVKASPAGAMRTPSACSRHGATVGSGARTGVPGTCSTAPTAGT